jgi:putative membrane protein
MKKMFLAAGAAALLITACSKDDSGTDNGSGMTVVNQTDVMFMKGTAESNTAEVGAGQLALNRGTNAAVKMFAQMMVNHHTMAQTKLKALGDSVRVSVPDSVSMENQMLMQRLSTLSGYSFDTAYMNSQIIGHQKTLNIFQMEMNNGQNMWVKNFANRNVGMIQQHYNMADSIRRTL